MFSASTNVTMYHQLTSQAGWNRCYLYMCTVTYHMSLLLLLLLLLLWYVSTEVLSW